MLVLILQAFLADKQDHTAVSAVRSIEFVGNRTECALLLMLRSWGHDYKGIRDSHRGSLKKVYAFSSATKMASVLIVTGEDSYRLYVKVTKPTAQNDACLACFPCPSIAND